MNINFKQMVEENIVIPSSFKTVSRMRKPDRINLSDDFVSHLVKEYNAQLKAYTSEDGRQDKRKCREDFKKVLSLALTQL